MAIMPRGLAPIRTPAEVLELRGGEVPLAACGCIAAVPAKELGIQLERTAPCPPIARLEPTALYLAGNCREPSGAAGGGPTSSD